MMKKKKAGVALVTVLLMFSAILYGCNSSAKGSMLKVGVRDDIIGLGYLNPVTEKYYGLEIDIADKLAEDLGYDSVEYVSVKPENRKDTLLEGKVDCLIAAYSISDTRKKNFDFSEPYYKDQLKIVVQNSSLFKSYGVLQGKTIGVLNGANAAPLFSIKMDELGLIDDVSKEVLKDSGGIDFKMYESYSKLSQALEEGEVDAICLDGSIANAYMNENRSFLNMPLPEQDYGVATQKDSKLSKSVDASIKKMLEDGTIEALIDKWD